MDELFTTRQLQDLLQIDRITIYRMLSDGRLRGFKMGGQWRFPRPAVETWLQEQQATAELHSSPETAPAVTPPGSDLSVSCMQAIQDVLAEALQIGAIVTAVDGQPLTVLSNANPFCSLLLGSPARRLCVNWWRKSALGLGARVQVLTCHAGLRCACGRINVQGRSLAVLHAGQFLDRDCDPGSEDWDDRIAGLAKAMDGIPAAARPALQQALLEVPTPDQDHQARLLCLVPRVVAAFAQIGEERARLMCRLRRIAEITNF